MRVYAVRHGQSGFNLQQVCNDDPARPGGDLTALGRRQAAAAAGYLAGRPIQALFCSPLPRTRQTAAVIAATLGLAARVDVRLNDIRSGFDGRPVADYLAAIAPDPLRARPAPGAETLLEHQARVDGFLDWLAGQPWQAVALVAHEETLRVLLSRATGVPLAQVVGRSFGNGQVHGFDLGGAACPSAG